MFLHFSRSLKQMLDEVPKRLANRNGCVSSCMTYDFHMPWHKFSVLWKQNGAATRKKTPLRWKKNLADAQNQSHSWTQAPLHKPQRPREEKLRGMQAKCPTQLGRVRANQRWSEKARMPLTASAKSGPHARVEDNEDQKRSTWPSQPESGKPSAQRPKLKQRAQHGAAAQHGPSSYAPARRFPATRWARLRRLQQRGWCEPRLGPPPAPKRPWFQSPWGGRSRAGLRMHQLCPGAGACKHHMPPQQKCFLNHQGRPTAGVPWRQSQVQLGVQGRTGETHPQGGVGHWPHHQVVVGEAGQPSHAQGEDILVRPNCEPGHEGRCGEVYACRVATSSQAILGFEVGSKTPSQLIGSPWRLQRAGQRRLSRSQTW